MPDRSWDQAFEERRIAMIRAALRERGDLDVLDAFEASLAVEKAARQGECGLDQVRR